MPSISFSQRWLAILLLAAAAPAAAQLSNSQPDPLSRIRDAAKTNVQACSTTGETLCEQVAPKIIALEKEESPLAENFRGMLLQLSVRKLQIREQVVAWGVAAFRAAGMQVRTEQNALPSTGATANSVPQDVVVAEIRGREKPQEWVVLAARIDGHDPARVQTAANAALIVEAARDIQLTGIRPRRSIRFVLLIGGYGDASGYVSGSWPYVYAHRQELDGARAAIFFSGGAGRVSGYFLNGRHVMESTLREAMKPIEALDAGHNSFAAPGAFDGLDFLLEGIPAISADQKHDEKSSQVSQISEDQFPSVIQELKRNAEIAAVTAFGIAEAAEPLAPRQSRAGIDSLLKATGLDERMKKANIWPLWESGQRGRQP